MMPAPLRRLLLGAAIPAAANAAPFLALGDQAGIFFTHSSEVRYDDNIYFLNVPTGDLIFGNRPGLELVFGKKAAIGGKLGAGETFTRYLRADGVDTRFFDGNGSVTYTGSKLQASINGSYVEIDQNTPDDPHLIRRNVATFGGSGEWEMTQLTSIEASVVYARKQYLRNGYGDSDDLTVPVDLYYRLTPKADVSVGYRFRAYRTTVGPESDDHYINWGVRGGLTPLVSGQVRVGYLTRHLVGGKTLNLLGVDSRLTYEMTPKTSLILDVSQRPETNPFGIQQRNFLCSLRMESRFSQSWSASASLGYRAIRYPSRTDDYTEAKLKVGYVMSSAIRFEGSYSHAHNRAVRPIWEYSSNIMRLGAVFRY